jgi:putative transposase
LFRAEYPVKLLCYVLKCSKSGYYQWINAGRPDYKSFDTVVSQIILDQYAKDKRQGIVSLRMNIKKTYGQSISKKVIYRYMKVHGIQSIIRKKKKKYGKVKHHEIPNLIKRNFNATAPNEKWSIDVTYIHTTAGVEYLCAIKDMFDKSIVAFNSSRFNDNELVMSVLKFAIRKIPYKDRKNLIIHSDQGSQFTSIAYRLHLKKNRIKHSVSYKGSCVDNVPIESWFSALKTECIYLNGPFNRVIARELVRNYIDYYNNERLQEQLNELTPYEYRMLALA